jgi:hypothetical protein
MDSITNLTCKDGIAHHLVDGQEPTHHRSVAGSTPASPTETRRSEACGGCFACSAVIPWTRIWCCCMEGLETAASGGGSWRVWLTNSRWSPGTRRAAEGRRIRLRPCHPQLPRSLLLASAYAGWAGSLPPEVVAERLERAMGEAELPPEQWVPGYLSGLFTDSAPAEVVARDLHARIPGSRLVVLPGVGHQATWRRPTASTPRSAASCGQCCAELEGAGASPRPPSLRGLMDYWSCRWKVRIPLGCVSVAGMTRTSPSPPCTRPSLP